VRRTPPEAAPPPPPGSAGGASPGPTADPKAKPAAPADQPDAVEVQRHVLHEMNTTLMVRNIPNKITTEGFMEAVDSLGYQNQYNFALLPIDTHSGNCKGYAFINFFDYQVAGRFCLSIDGFRFQQGGKNKQAQVAIAHTQGVQHTLEQMRPWKKKNRIKFADNQQGRPFLRDVTGLMISMMAEEALQLLRTNPNALNVGAGAPLRSQLVSALAA